MTKKFSFHPGETVVLNFVLPLSIYDVKAVAISFRDKNRIVYEGLATGFVSEDEEIDDGEGNVTTIYKTRVGFSLKQAESLQFDENTRYMMQLNVFGPNASRIASDEMLCITESQQLIEPGFGGSSLYDYNSNYGQASETKEEESISYNDLTDKPKINDITLEGNRQLPEESISIQQIEEITSSI